MFKRLLIILFTFLFIASICSARNFYREITPYKCRRADAVVYAKVMRIQQIDLERVPTAGIVSSLGQKNLIRVLNAYKGALDNSYIEVLTQGGTLPEGIKIILAGEPEFMRGEKIILFLTKRKEFPWYYEVYENRSGKIDIENEDELKEAEKVLSRYL